ncbi:GNAT family N-acetyltransferase, partial [Pelagibacteraceae bacterium]|nr:GNAT family N-acetyltransferase [Pelagibacteraceae bacterium]
SDSILTALNKNLLNKYFEILIKSENIFLFFCEYKNENIGYAIFSSQPSYLINEFKSLKYSILQELIFSLKFKTIANILLSLFKIDLILLSKKNKSIINKNLNLNLLAIKREFQSKGIGRKFVSLILDDIKKKKSFSAITVETNNINTKKFYIEKLNFYCIGKKIRLFKNQDIFLKNL